METQKIIEILRKGETDYLKTKEFSQLPGIYAFFFIGDNFPILGDTVNKHQIIYIGKTESSQEKRDAKTHFVSGKTGSSTFRKSIGSILCVKENLKPIPRNDKDYEKGRMSHFKFDSDSEEIITTWMKNNLALSFFEYPKSKQEIENLETRIIHELIPILNISKNPNNAFGPTLQKLRKNCALMASEQFQKNPKRIRTNLQNNIISKPRLNAMASGKYIDLWSKKTLLIRDKLKNASTQQSIQLNFEEFNQVGNRANYSFNLEFANGIVSNNIGGSAVARDLAKVLKGNTEVTHILKTGHFKIRMDKYFCLWLEKK